MTPERFWDARPRRALEWRELEGGQCVLLRPKFGRGRIGRWLASRLADPHYRIRLDEIGTYVWKACDGKTPLLTIADGMRAAIRSGYRASRAAIGAVRPEDVALEDYRAGGDSAGEDRGRYSALNLFVIGSLRSLPKARVVIRTPGGAWRRLYSALSTMSTIRLTRAGSKPSASISPGVRSFST